MNNFDTRTGFFVEPGKPFAWTLSETQISEFNKMLSDTLDLLTESQKLDVLKIVAKKL